jgi:hypothetical protein
MNQASFEFDAPRALQPPATGDAPEARAPSLQDMALRLEQDPDYRVLRRLVPITDHGPAPASGELRWVLVLDTETTGLSHLTDKIIELAMLLGVAAHAARRIRNWPGSWVWRARLAGNPTPSTVSVHLAGSKKGRQPVQRMDTARERSNPFTCMILVRLAGIEPTTLGFGGQYSIH